MGEQFLQMLMIPRLDRADDIDRRDIGTGEGAIVHHLLDARANRRNAPRQDRTTHPDGSLITAVKRESRSVCDQSAF